MKFAIALTSALVVLCISSVAHATVMLEPFAGYASGKAKGGLQSTSTDSYDMSGVLYGGRLGIRHMGLMIGGEYLGGNMTVKETTSNVSFSNQNIGAYLGYQFPVLGLRIYGTYFLSSQATAASTPQVKLSKGNAYKVGIGLQSIPYLAVNLEYFHADYAQANAGTGAVDLSPKEQFDVYMLTLSFPIPL